MSNLNADGKQTKTVGGKIANERMSLVDFRWNAPQMTGFREALLAYRKSLPNIWDYNAYVGILLGVGGRKDDEACWNFAIGQGDNGNNTKKTLEERGLMPVFKKYQGKKPGLSVLLSDVEAEIITIVPAYEQIRLNLWKILNGGAVTKSAVQPVRQAVSAENVSSKKELISENPKDPAYDNMPSHQVFYSFPIVFNLYGNIHPNWINSEFYNFVQEYDGDLYFAHYDKEQTKITFCRRSARQNGRLQQLAEFLCEGYVGKNGKAYEFTDICRLGGNYRTFCVYNDRIYYSEALVRGYIDYNPVNKHNTICSMDLNGNDRREELNHDKKAPLTCPYVTDRAFIFEEGFWIDRITGKKKFIKKGDKPHYLSINESALIAKDSDQNIFEYDFATEKRTPIEKIYKGAKGKEIIYIDAEKDILYFWENKNTGYSKKSKDVCGKIVGIAKDGSVVDVWQGLQGYYDGMQSIDGVKHFSSDDDEAVSAVLFNGRNRIYKVSMNLIGEHTYADLILSVGRDGIPEQLYKKEWAAKEEKCDSLSGRSICSVVHMLTPNYFISLIADGDSYFLDQMRKQPLEKLFSLNAKNGYYSLFS